MLDVNPKNLARLENNDMNNKSTLVKHVYSQNGLKLLKNFGKRNRLKKKIFGVLFYSFQ